MAISITAEKESGESRIPPAGDSVSEGCRESALDHLPDAVLLCVFSHLPASQVLGAVRATCHRWRQLALRPEVWRRAEVHLRQGRDLALAFRVLRLAPCLRTLHLHLPAMPMYLTEAASITSCAVQRLELSLATPTEVRAAVRMIRNQAPHVHSLRLSFVSTDAEGVAQVLDVVASDLGLEELSLSFQQQPPELLAVELGTGCLRRLQLRGESESLAESLIRANSASLRRVELSCPLCRAVAARLRECERLEAIALRASWLGAQQDTEELVQSLRISTLRVTSLQIEFDSLDLDVVPSDDPVLVELLGALAGSSLSSLCLSGLTLSWADYAVRLAGVLCALPRLSTLRLHHAEAAAGLLLDALAVREFPALQLLELTGCRGRSAMPAIRRLLQSNPGLHVTGDISEDDEGSLIGLYTHPQSMDCPECRKHRHDVRWHWLGVNPKPYSEIALPPADNPWGRTSEATKQHKVIENSPSETSFWCCCDA